MRKIIAITHLTLDGVMQAPGGPDEDTRGGFTHGGWAMRYGNETVKAALLKLMAGKFDLLLGRRTYEIFAAYWPYAGGNPVAKAFNRATKFVATRTLDEFDWENSQSVGPDAVARVRRLKASSGPDLHVWGSGDLLQSLIAANLVDEFRQWVCPVVLGEGRRLFEHGLPPRGLKLVKSQASANGVLLNTYHPGPLPAPAASPGKPTPAEIKRRRKLAAEEVARSSRRRSPRKS